MTLKPIKFKPIKFECQWGDPLLPLRFWSKVWVDPNGCWIWLAAKTGGYGVFGWEGQVVRVHRLARHRLVGDIPIICVDRKNKVCDHLCRNRACCNPAHIEVVTNKENVMRGESFSAKHARKDCCPKCGGEYCELKNGQRLCLECKNARNRKYMHGYRKKKRLPQKEI